MKLTTKGILANWINARGNSIIANYNIEEEVPEYGRKLGVQHSAGTYTRAMRSLMEDAEEIKFNNGIIVRRVEDHPNGYAQWQISRS